MQPPLNPGYNVMLVLVFGEKHLAAPRGLATDIEVRTGIVRTGERCNRVPCTGCHRYLSCLTLTPCSYAAVSSISNQEAQLSSVSSHLFFAVVSLAAYTSPKQFLFSASTACMGQFTLLGLGSSPDYTPITMCSSFFCRQWGGIPGRDRLQVYTT